MIQTMNTKIQILALTAGLFLAGCADPSQSVPAANVSTNNSSASASSAKPSAAGKAFAIQPENSKVEFTGSKVTGKHDGGFKQFQGEVHVANGAIAHAKVTIDTTSIYTDTDRLTGHLKSPDFFDVAKYPTAVFETTSITGQGANSTVTGNLTLHGITKQITFPAKVDVKDDAVTLNAEFSINRKDFEIKYAGKPDDLIRDNVVLRLDVKAGPKQA
jgi:polyisoprenoid-binding protein YceI